MIILTESKLFLRPWMDGSNVGPISFVRRSKDTPAIRAHELTHEEWFWKQPFTYGLRCLFDKEFHLASEVAAYKAQIAVDPSMLQSCAACLATQYGFDLTTDAALKLLTE